MSPVEIGILANLIISLALIPIILRQWRSQVRLVDHNRRVMALASELAYAREAQQRLNEFQDSVAASMDHTGQSARAVHQAIAGIPFDILEQIPATRDSAKQIRKVHDLASDGIYAGMSLYARWRKGRMQKPTKAANRPARPAPAIESQADRPHKPAQK